MVIDFDDVPAAAAYHVGDTLSSSGYDFALTDFQWGGGTWTSGGVAGVATWGTLSGSTGQAIYPNNINLALTLASPAPYLRVLFANYGGDLNVEVNGDFRNVTNFMSLDGTVIGGATLTVSLVTPSSSADEEGELYFDGAINSFKIGGQEMIMDNVAIPEPASLSLLAMGGLAMLRRRRRG
jgi:hypothetical protein